MIVRKNRLTVVISLLLIGGFVSIAAPLHAEPNLSADVVSNYLDRLLGVNETFQKQDSLRVLVVHGQSDDSEYAEQLRETLLGRDYRVTLVSNVDLSRENILRSDLLVNVGDRIDTKLDQVLVEQGVLSFTTKSGLVEKGYHSVGMVPPETSGTESIRGAGGSKPKLVYNLDRLKREGHSFPSSVMVMGKVYK